MDTPDFIVPPPGLIPAAPPPRETADEEVPETSRRVLPSFPPPSAFPSPPTNTTTISATTITPKPARPVGAWRLRGAGGLEVPLRRPVLLGRDPADPSRADAASVALVDPARTVSKTHALVEVVGDRVLVTDLHSTNGTRVLVPHGAASELVPGEQAEAPLGATVLLGEFALHVDRAPIDTV